MTASENLRRELESIEDGIEELRELLYDAEEDVRRVRRLSGWIRTPGFRMLRVDLKRRIRGLEQRRDVVRTCYAEARRYEEWLELDGQAGRREVSVG